MIKIIIEDKIYLILPPSHLPSHLPSFLLTFLDELKAMKEGVDDLVDRGGDLDKDEPRGKVSL